MTDIPEQDADIVGDMNVNDTIKDAAADVVEGRCTDKTVIISGVEVDGFQGLCLTQYEDSMVDYIILNITSEGDLVYLNLDVHFVNPDSTKILLKTRCMTGKECDITKATETIEKVFIKNFQLKPIGNVIVQAQPGVDTGEVTIRAIGGTGELEVIHYVYETGEEISIGKIQAPTINEQAEGIENIGELDTNNATLEIDKSVAPDKPKIEEDTGVHSQNGVVVQINPSSQGCEVTFGTTNYEPMAMMAIIAALLAQQARRMARESGRKVVKMANGTTKDVKKALKQD